MVLLSCAEKGFPNDMGPLVNGTGSPALASALLAQSGDAQSRVICVVVFGSVSVAWKM